MSFDPVLLLFVIPAAAAVLIAATVLIGLYPPLLLNLIKSGFETPLMSTLVKGPRP